MNYEKLVNKLRSKIYDYSGEKEIQFSKILKEAVKRKCNTKEFIKNKNRIDSIKENKLLFRTL
jgi:hypothetical protein